MSLLTSENAVVLWQEVIKTAQQECSILLKEELEAYLISLLIRYTNKPEIVEQVFAIAYLDALELPKKQRHFLLQHLGDQCLLFSGLFPHNAERRQVKISYFVNLGRQAYQAVSNQANDLYWSLGFQFVSLMDILQSIRNYPDLLPLEAYEQWQAVGSQRALRILKNYSSGIPLKNMK